jgi:hypothetical protein
MSSERKLSKLQKFILLEAAKTLPELEDIVRRENAWRRSGVAIGVIKADSKPVEATNVAHVTRQEILVNYFKLSWRKKRFMNWVTDLDTDRIDAESDPARYNRANATLYRAIRRLETRGLIRRMNRLRAGLQLTEKGIVVAAKLNPRGESNAAPVAVTAGVKD